MRAMRFVCASMVAGAVCLAPSHASAQENPQALRQEIDQLRKDFEALKQQYGDRLTALEARLAATEGTPPAAPAPRPHRPSRRPSRCRRGGRCGRTERALPVYGATAASSKIFNPDIAVIGDFLGAAGSEPGQSRRRRSRCTNPKRRSRPIVDPYARADFFLSFGEEGVELEEGFITFPTLPGGLLTKVGKMRAAFGKVNTLHNHVLPWTDRPLVTNEPGRRRGRDRRCRHLGGAADPESVDLPRSDRSGVSRRFRATCSTSSQARAT